LQSIVWGYAHLFVFAGIALLGAGIGAELDLVSEHSHTTRAVVSWWLGGPLAVFLLAMWLARDRHFTRGARGAALPVMAAASIIAATLGAPSWAYAALAVLTVIWRVPLGGSASRTKE
jgi:low temperature requirement protein LtrA